MLRKIIEINEEKCDGCENCIPACAEGALQIIDGKARLISDLFCDGLGACIGECPTGAMKIIEREAEPYDERKVMDYIVKGGPNVIKAHIKHLKDHEEFEYMKLAVEYLNEKGIPNPLTMDEAESTTQQTNHGGGCPGSRLMSFDKPLVEENETGSRISHLTQWPIQFHLISPQAAYYKDSHLLLAADCCAFAHGDFHKDFMKGKSLVIACPKLDSHQETYSEKLKIMLEESNLQSITILIMQVPCCGGLAQLAQQAIVETKSDIPAEVIILGIQGEILKKIKIN
ncbi:ATP-binding protein [Bacteroidota bacterium]